MYGTQKLQLIEIKTINDNTVQFPIIRESDL